MKNVPSSLLAFSLPLFLACSSGSSDSSELDDGDREAPQNGVGGSLGSGGAAPAGGATATGGVSGSAGGAPSSGGQFSASGGAGTNSDPCSDGEWTCLRTEPSGPYGTRVFSVPAAQNWVNTGLYLKTGQTATLTVGDGTWKVNDDEGSTIDHGECLVGDFVARIGLYYKDQELTCVDGTTDFVADKDGILFVGALPSNDLGETYETRFKATGAKELTVTSNGDTVPTVLSDEASTFDFSAVSSGWVEIFGEHVILTLPTSSAETDKSVLHTAVSTLDQIYESEEELRGAVPQHGQRLRFFPDGTNPGYMLAGNPIRMQTSLVTESDRISRAGQEGVGIWGFAHEMGHDFSFVNRMWTYQDNTLESWCNLFSIYALENLSVPLHDATTSCTTDSTGNYDTWDAWGGLCFLRQFQFEYGWEFYKSFFSKLNEHENNQGISDFNDVHDAFEGIAGEDVTPTFQAWNVPNPG